MSKSRSTAESEDNLTRLQMMTIEASYGVLPQVKLAISWSLDTIKSQSQEIKRLREQLRIANEFNSHHKEPQGDDQ